MNKLLPQFKFLLDLLRMENGGGGGGGGRSKRLPSLQIFPVTFPNVGASCQNFLTFSFSTLAILL